MTAAAVRRLTASGLVGLLAGALYRLLDVPSPAPPWAALAGLLGILAGEHATRALLNRFRPRPAPQREQTPQPPEGHIHPARRHR
ncbi:XapX domain-containing protein [Streptomyces sp. NPDC007088]|uniref:XapX domain-containing protein n=1 Tax=Streptomyces sp. NPDC007088 TaxID=3364773 RepID=UPI0036B44808